MGVVGDQSNSDSRTQKKTALLNHLFFKRLYVKTS